MAKVEKIAEYGLKGKTGKVLAFCNDRDPAIRAAAAKALAGCKGDDSYNMLVGMIRDESLEVRKQAVSSLGDLGYPRASEHIRHEMNKEDDKEFHEACAQALAKLSSLRS